MKSLEQRRSELLDVIEKFEEAAYRRGWEAAIGASPLVTVSETAREVIDQFLEDHDRGIRDEGKEQWTTPVLFVSADQLIKELDAAGFVIVPKLLTTITMLAETEGPP